MDVLDLFARTGRLLAARAAHSAGRGDVADQLRAWDGSMVADAVAPAVFWGWYRELQRLTYEDESPDYRPAATLHRWLTTGDSPWFDDVRTPEIETLDTIADSAMSEVLTGGGVAPWADVHPTVMDHPLGIRRSAGCAVSCG